MIGRIVPQYNVYRSNEKVLIEGEDPLTGREYSFEIPAEGYTAFKHGAKIQDVFPELTSEQREIILTGLTSEGFDRYLAGESGAVEVDFGFRHTDPFFDVSDLPEKM